MKWEFIIKGLMPQSIMVHQETLRHITIRTVGWWGGGGGGPAGCVLQ